ncbi:MAG: FmdB family zinc ribbon protein [Bacteroidota bacterium]
MPTYDYKCLDCGYAFEHFQRITEEPLSKCPLCSGDVKRLIGAGSSPIFKGSGFYQTDYKNNSNKSVGSSSEKKSDSSNSSSSVEKTNSSNSEKN